MFKQYKSENKRCGKTSKIKKEVEIHAKYSPKTVVFSVFRKVDFVLTPTCNRC